MDYKEPKIINYYNELPDYAIVINDLNQEYEELITNYIQLSDNLEPIIIKEKSSLFFKILLFISVIEFTIIVILI